MVGASRCGKPQEYVCSQKAMYLKAAADLLRNIVSWVNCTVSRRLFGCEKETVKFVTPPTCFRPAYLKNGF